MKYEGGIDDPKITLDIFVYYWYVLNIDCVTFSSMDKQLLLPNRLFISSFSLLSRLRFSIAFVVASFVVRS
jgi:hypothetical protein